MVKWIAPDFTLFSRLSQDRKRDIVCAGCVSDKGVNICYEWAVAKDGSIYILQCRPLKQIKTLKTDLPEPEFKAINDDIIARGGITANPGVASGEVYLVDKGIDMLRFPEGAVLVARQALPRWASP